MSEPRDSLAPARFKKLTIGKPQLPPPFWTEARAAKYREMYGGEDTPGYQCNVLGKWGSPSYSVFPMHVLKPLLKYIPAYRLVTAIIDRGKGRVHFRAARLSPEIEIVDGTGRGEEVLERDERAFNDPIGLAHSIAAYFPAMTDWVDPVLYAGADLGSAQDPSEYIFVRVIGKKWTDVFRLHLSGADWPVQASIVAHLDHASGHRVKYGFDSGSAGSMLIQILTETGAAARCTVCPVCSAPIYFAERLRGFNFGEHVDEIDIDTGEPSLSPDRKDARGNPMPHRLSNKEFSTRILERKAQAVELEIACDGGADNQRLSGPQLLVNHTSSGKNAKGERKFKESDDHHVDARRQLALRIVAEKREIPSVPATPENVKTMGTRTRWFEDTDGGVSGGGFGSAGGVLSGL